MTTDSATAAAAAAAADEDEAKAKAKAKKKQQQTAATEFLKAAKKREGQARTALINKGRQGGSDAPPPTAMKANPETGKLEVFHSEALIDDLPDEEKDEGEAADEMGDFLDDLDTTSSSSDDDE